MDRRTILKMLSGVPFLPLVKDEYESPQWDYIIDGGEEYYSYYFGGFATGKTTRLVNEAVVWLDANPDMSGLFVTNHYHGIQYTLSCIEAFHPKNDSIGYSYSKLHGTLTLPNKSTLRFTCQDLIDSDLYCRYQGLWTDQITTEKREILRNGLIAGYGVSNARVQHVISMDEAHELNNRLGHKPILISNNAYISSDREEQTTAKLWGFR